MEGKFTNRESCTSGILAQHGHLHWRNGFAMFLMLLAWMTGYHMAYATNPDAAYPFPLVAPANDDLCNAIPLTMGASCNGFDYTTVDATLETNEPSPPFCFSVVKTVWFSFTAPASGIVQVSTPNADPNLWMGRAIYYLAGGPPNCNNLTNLILLGCSSDQYEDVLTTCGLAPGETYYIQIVTQTSPNEDDFCIEIIEEELADAGPDQVLCNVTSTTLAATAPVFSEGIWVVISGTATITNPYSPTSGVTGLVPGTSAVLEWNVGYCPLVSFKEGPLGLMDYASYDQMTITVDELPTTADAGSDQLDCDTFTAAFANTPVVGTGLWSVVSGTATLATPSLPTTAVTGLVHGTVATLQWTITNGTCPASTDQMTISVLTDPDAGPDQQLCTDVNSTTLAANPVTVGFGFWSVISGMAVIDDYSSPTTSVMLTPGVPTALEWFIFFPPEGCDRRDTMMITWDNAPSIADAGPDQVLCNQTSTTLAANTPVDGTGSWNVYSGTATIVDPSSPTTELTGLIPGTTVVLEWSITNGVCVPSSDVVMITVDELPTSADAGPLQILCDQFSTTLQGNTPVVGTGLWTFNAGTATITDPTSPTSGLTDLVPGTYVELHWTISNGSCPSSTDFVYIFDETPPVVNAGADQQLCNVTSTDLGAEPLSCDYNNVCQTGYWTVISGTANITDPSSPTSQVTGLIPGTSVTLQWTLGIENDYFCAGTDEVTITVDALPTPADAGVDQSLCDQTSTFLNANTPAEGVGMWSLVSGSANINSPASPTSEVTGLIPGTSATLSWTITNGICPASADEMTITADDLPTAANAGPDQQLCNQNNTTLSANTPVTGTGQWTLISGTANITNPSSPASGVTGLIIGASAVLQWNITNGSCPPSTDQVTITVSAPPTTSNAGPDQQLCNQNSTNLAANTPLSGTGLWTLISGTANITNPLSPVSGLTGLLADASVVLQWTITNGTCPASMDQVMITVSALPTISNAGPDQQLCNLTTTTLAANTPGIGIGQWSLVSGTANITSPGSPTSGVTGLVPGTTAVLAWTITNGACPASVDQVSITVYAPPSTSDAGPDQQLCNQFTTTLAANTPAIGNGLWSVISGTANVTNPASPTSGVTGLLPDASVVLQWTISNGTCPPATDQVTITVSALPSPSNAGPDQELCNQTTTTVFGNNPSVGNGLWTVVSGVATITSPASPVSGITGLVPGTSVILQWTISNGICPPSSDQMMITIYALPTPSNAGPDQQFCNQTTTTLAANTPVSGSGLWTVVSGSASVTNPSSPTSEVTGLIPGTSATLQWKITNGTCPPSTDLVKIKVDALPSTADAGPDKFLCDQSATVVNAEEPLIGTGLWSVVSGTATVIPPDQPSAAVLNLINGASATLQWAVSNGTCPASIDQMNIHVSEAPTEAEAGPDQLVCNSTSTNLQANTPDVGIGYWLKLSGPGEITNPESPTSEITGLQSGVPTVVQWTIWNGYCQPSTDEVILEINEEAVIANAGPDQLICGETTVTLSGNDPGNGNGIWTIIQGSATITDPNNPATELSDLIPGKTIVLAWTITSGSCPPSIDQVSIFVDQSAGFADAGPDQVLCQQESTIVEGNIPNGGSGQWTVISGAAEVTPADEPIAQVTNLMPGTPVVLQWTITNATCPPDSDQVIIYIEEEPSTALAGVDQTLCDAASALLSANTPLFGTGLWSVVMGSANIADPSSPATTVSGLIPGDSVVLQWEITNAGCPPSSDQVVLQIDEMPSASDAGPDQLFCDNTNTTLHANTPLIGQGSWSVINGTASVTDPLSPVTSVTDLQPGNAVTLQWTVSNGVCPVSNDLMTIQVDHLPSPADAGPDQALCGDNATSLNANVPVFGQGQWSLVNGNATIVDPLSPVTGLTDLTPANTVTLQWTVSNGTCPLTTDEVNIEIKVPPTEADAGVDQSLCEESQSVLNANLPGVGTGQWEIISGSGMLADLTQPGTMVTGLSAGSPLILQWITTYESCQSKDTITLSTFDAPSEANAGADQAICATASILEGNIPTTGTGTWTILSGTGILSDVFNPASSITGLIPGTSVVLQWMIANGACPASADQVTILVDTVAPMAIAGDDQQLCGTTVTTVQALPPNIGTGTWTVISGTAIIEDSLAESTSVSGLVPGSTAVLRWTVSGNACPPAHDDMVITIDALLEPADAGPDETICSTSLMLSAENPPVGTGVWTIISGTGSLQNQFDPHTLLTDLPEGTSIGLEWKITNGICPPVADTVTISSVFQPDIPVAGDDQVLCNSADAILMANHPDPGKGMGTWSLVSGAGVIENLNESVTNVSGLSLGTNLFAWTISNGACPPLSDTVMILNNDGATLEANFLVSEFACTGDSVHMFDISGNATLPSGFMWDFGDQTTSTERDPVHVYSQQGDYTITMTTILDGCGTASTSKVIRVFNCASHNPGNGGTRKVMYANVFPNPSDEDFQVSIKLREESEVDITLFDAAGRITESRKISDEKDILTIFQVEVPGLYFFRINVGLEVLIFKVVKVETTH